MSAIDGTERLLTAGAFAARTLLSAKALRIYAERGLLPPHRVHEGNGYRYYHPDQVATGWLIALLRSADLPLDEIDRIVGSDTTTAVRLLDQAAEDLERRLHAQQAVLHRARLHLREETSMSDVTTDQVPDQPVLSLLRRMRPEQMDTIIPTELARLRAAAAQAGLRETGDPFGVFHGPITEDSDGPLEITLPVDALSEDSGEIRSYRLTGSLVANRHAVGPETDFPQILALYDEVHSWITGSGWTPAGPPREIWHNAPSDPEPLDLTISWPYVAGRP